MRYDRHLELDACALRSDRGADSACQGRGAGVTFPVETAKAPGVGTLTPSNQQPCLYGATAMADVCQYTGNAPGSLPENDAPALPAPNLPVIRRISRIYGLAAALQVRLPDGVMKEAAGEIKALALDLMAEVRAGR